MTPRQKRAILVELIELYVQWGYDITPLVGQRLSHFDYDAIKQTIKDVTAEHADENEY